MSNVFVLDYKRRPIDMCSNTTARILLDKKKASVLKLYPFTIILNKEVDESVCVYRLKLDPGSKTTGLAILRGEEVVWAANLDHRGMNIKSSLLDRSARRRNRRTRKLRYRPARFNNRTKPKGWLAPSLMSRVHNIETWVRRLLTICPISEYSMELVRFDMQKMNNPEISGVEYQQGELLGYEIREYLLEKWQRKCSYCNKENVPFEIEHITPKSRGGTNRVTNLCLACHDCNDKKDRLTAAEFGFPDIQKKASLPLKDAASVNSTRFAILNMLKKYGNVETGSGGKTKYNRCRLNLPKEHWIDAACVADVENVVINNISPLYIKAKGHGSRKMIVCDKYGFARNHRPVNSPLGGVKGAHRNRNKKVNGFETGDFVIANVPKGKNKGIQRGRISRARASGTFGVGKADGISSKYMKIIFHNDGYEYSNKFIF